MSSRAIPLLLVLAASLLASPPASALESSRALLSSLRAKGRAEATLRYTLPGFPGDPVQEIRGTLALEPPDRARLDVATTGEVIAVRADGGDWLDPAAHQLVRLSPQRVAPALRWWRVLLGSGGEVHERRESPGRWWLVLPARAGAPGDSALVQLDARGLPARLELPSDAGPTLFRISGWRFVAAKGAAGFRLALPPGTVEVRLP